jgi:hypothetical protein
MARQYPRFLYSDPQNTKSKGPFIISALPPHIIAKIRTDAEVDFHTVMREPKFIWCGEHYFIEKLNFLTVNELKDDADIVVRAWKDMADWVKSQVLCGAIDIYKNKN